MEVAHHISSTTFTLDSTYSDLKVIGKGSYGIVVSAYDKNRNARVAIKKITPMAKHEIDAKHILREVRIMRYMGKHENIVSLKNMHVREASDELYIVMELMDTDLHRVLQSKQILTEAHFRHFLFQILCGLRYLHDNRIIHRDLKPGNLLVTRDCQLRITDFGLAREKPSGTDLDSGDEVIEPMTEHVVTRWYRPPELMLCPDGLYTTAVDLWSVGCIFAEMLGRKPLFPGKNFVHQLSLIFDVIGTPSHFQVSHIKNMQAKKFLESQSGKEPIILSKMYPQASPESLDLLKKLLLFEPIQRLDANEALNSPFLDKNELKASPALHHPDSDDRCEFDFERDGSSKARLKSLILLEAESMKQENTYAGREDTKGTYKVVVGGIASDSSKPCVVKKNDNNTAIIALQSSDVQGNLSNTRHRSNRSTLNKVNHDVEMVGEHTVGGAKCKGDVPVAKKGLNRNNQQKHMIISAAASGTVIQRRANDVVSSGYGQYPRISTGLKRPVSAPDYNPSALQSTDDRQKEAIISARAWLTAAAAAADESGASSLQTIEDHSRARRLIDKAAMYTMDVLKSPPRVKNQKSLQPSARHHRPSTQPNRPQFAQAGRNHQGKFVEKPDSVLRLRK